MSLISTKSAIILSGGNSERMGFPKAFLQIENKTFVHKIVDDYKSAGVEKIIVVMNAIFCEREWLKYFKPIINNVTIIKNNHPEFGKYYSLKLGVDLLGESEMCFMHPVDQPCVEKSTLIKLMNENFDGVTSPVYEGKSGHPVLLGEDVISFIKNTNNNSLNLKDVFSNFPKSKVEVEDLGVLININNKGDYYRFIQQELSV